MSSVSSSEDEESESETSPPKAPPPVAAVAKAMPKRSDTPAPQRKVMEPSCKMRSDAHERGDAAKRSPQLKQQQPAASGRQVQDDKPTPSKDARRRQKEGSAQEATLAENTRKRERPETPPRGHVAKGEYVLHDLPNVVKLFARGWMEEKQYTLLYKATKELQITVPRDITEHYDRFRKNLLMKNDREGNYNHRVSRALDEMRGIRLHLARADVSLSNEQTEECLMAWAEEHYFTRAEHKKDADEREKILSDVFVKELGCKFRIRAVLKRGLQDFKGITKDTDMLDAFLKYVIAVEQEAEKLRAEKKRTIAVSDSSSEKDNPAPASAAQERAVPPKRPPTAPIPAEGISGKKETKDPPARKIKKGRKNGKKKQKKKPEADQPRVTPTAKEGGKGNHQVPYQGRWSW